MSFSQEDDEAPENWEDIDTTVEANKDISKIPCHLISRPKIIRTDDLGDHTPFKPSIKILSREKCTESMENVEESKKDQKGLSLREREQQYMEARNRIFNSKNTD